MADSPGRQSSEGTGGPSVAYDADKLGEQNQRGVPMGEQYPTNEADEKKDIVADVDIPGPYPTDRGDPTGRPFSNEPAPTKETRGGESLGDVVHGSSLTNPGDVAGGAASTPPGRGAEQDPATPQGKIDKARAESFPGGVPEDADVGTGRRKGQGLPPGSVGKGQDTPQTPAT